ncbi:MAG: DinB family protein [Desulfobacterales bacterium]|nr:DinB family protein [Desulfobacterales bacterium]
MKDKRQLIDSLGKAVTVLGEFVATIPAEKRDLRRGEGFWTVREHVSHLADVQPMLLERLERFVAEAAPAFVPFMPDDDDQADNGPPNMSMEAALAQFGDYRQRQLALLVQAESGTWQKTATHPEYAQYSFYILVRHILMHDYWHMYRMEELWLTRDAFLTEL